MKLKTIFEPRKERVFKQPEGIVIFFAYMTGVFATFGILKILIPVSLFAVLEYMYRKAYEIELANIITINKNERK